MDKKIFTLPAAVFSIAMASIGYYWGAAFQQAKVVDVRLNKDKQSASAVKNPVLATNSVASPLAIATSAATATVTDKIAAPKSLTPTASKVIKKAAQPAPTPITTQPAKAPVATTPTTQPTATTPVPAPAPQPAPAPTTKVS
jgi:hypothetical protein